MHIDISVLLTILFGAIAFIGYLGNVLVKGVSCLTTLKKDIEYIKLNQADIIKDIEIIQKKVYK
ncbi:hypothetical protein [Sulfuricurvum sp.]|uniref:hypothetical protein n=1 Tax=Sulfuricurvum sp. TaxID=2025608 RepID=UPI0026252124|nr:hypothetical protein [Sulfuricurvum sp.]MDD4949648.1 hypothetical protein [Sulfuricurvum sp.]